MHMIIRAIVYADDKLAALKKAKEVFEYLTDGEKPFDYYGLFGNDDYAEDRWGHFKSVYNLTEKDGIRLVEEGWESTVKDMEEYFEKGKEYLNKCKTVHDILSPDPKDADASMGRWYLGKLGSYDGSSVWLYDNDGSGIATRDHLDNTISKWKCLYEDRDKKNPYAGLDVWVVPADVHF